MFFYKTLDSSGDLIQIESRSQAAVSLAGGMVEISESEYQTLMETLTADAEQGAEEIEKTEFQAGYEQALLDMLEVGI